MEEAGFGGLFAHGGGGGFEGEEDADGGGIAFDDAAEVADLGGGDVAGFDLEDDGFGIAGGVGEIESAVDALVGAFFLFEGAGVDEAECPVLELVFIGGGEGASGFEVAGFADDGVDFGDVGAEGVGEADLDEVDGEVGDVDADPAAVEFLGSGDGGGLRRAQELKQRGMQARRLVQLAFPQSQYSPAKTVKLPSRRLVPRNIRLKFCPPELDAGFWHAIAIRAGVLMPKTPVNENYLSEARKD